MSLDWSSWRSCHLFYHGDGNFLLHRLVSPLVSSLLQEGSIDHFFFIRYELGGPHVRLRLRIAQEAGDATGSAVAATAADFFSRWPSTQPLASETVIRRSREILAADPNETDIGVYPDNSLQCLPFVPEVDRYGGSELIGASLDFFALSSVRAIELVRSLGGQTLSRQIPGFLRVLAAQALGFARDEPELLSLLGYAKAGAGHPLAPFSARGDRTFAEQPEAFRALLLDILFDEPSTGGPLDEARRLAAAIGDAAPVLRERILRSHMHMTANRLGIRNPQEAFLSQILWRAATEHSEQLSPDLRHAWHRMSTKPLDAAERLEHLLPTAFAAMIETFEPAAASGAEACGRR